MTSDSQVRYVHDSYPQRGTAWGRTMARGRSNYRGSSNFRGSFNRPASNTFCPGCNYLAKELHLNVDFNHFPSQCPRKRSVLRLLKIEEANLDEEDTAEHEQGAEEDHEQPDTLEGKSFSSDINDMNIRKVWKSKSPELKGAYLRNHLEN